MKQIAQIDIKSVFFGVKESGTNFQELNSIANLVSLFLKISFVLAGLILLFYFILGGIGMIGSAGKNDPKAAEQAKQTITSAVIGFVVVFTAYWIVKLIGQLLGMPNII
jgi:dihydrodipicolinate synthase/N-acetylneuraminate lyase